MLWTKYYGNVQYLSILKEISNNIFSSLNMKISYINSFHVSGAVCHKQIALLPYEELNIRFF